MQSEPIQIVERQSHGVLSEETPKYSNYDKVIENKFHVRNRISKLFSSGDDSAFSGDDEFGIPDQTVQPKTRKNLSCNIRKKIRKKG